MEEDKNLEQNLDKSNEKLHISDVSGCYSLEEAKKFAKEKFNSDSLKNKYPRVINTNV